MKHEEALKNLVAGNVRYMTGKLEEKDYRASRSETANEQHPFAVILGCSDSRVTPEIVFDQSIGDLFVVRTAGNVVDDVALGSIQYAVAHLHVELVVVLGHEKCGAVTAAVDDADEGGGIAVIIEAIRPAVEATADMPGNSVENAVAENAIMIASKLRTDEMLVDTTILAAKYHLETGRVELL